MPHVFVPNGGARQEFEDRSDIPRKTPKGRCIVNLGKVAGKPRVNDAHDSPIAGKPRRAVLVRVSKTWPIIEHYEDPFICIFQYVKYGFLGMSSITLS